MEYNESNFIYLKKTSMEKYYEELLKAEFICEYYPVITKIIVRKVLETFLRDIAEKHNMENNLAIWNLLNNIKFNSNFSLPDGIYDSITTVLANGYEHPTRYYGNRKNQKHPIEILELMHKIMCWYMKKAEVQVVKSVKDLSFRAPSTIEYMNKEVSKIKNDIALKVSQINKLRQKIIEFSSQSKGISEINNIVIEIKKEKTYLEETEILLTKKIEMQREQISSMDKNYKGYLKKLDKLGKKCNENQELLFEKESQLVKAEVQNLELKDLVKSLDESDKSIETKEQCLEEELRVIREAYEKLSKLTNQYQDILETMEFSSDKVLQKALEAQKNNIKTEIIIEDGLFNENLIDYTKNINEVKKQISIFKVILDEKIKRNIKYEHVYRGFLRLEGKELRILYTIINNSNLMPNIINRSKELLLKSLEDKFLELLSKNFEDFKDVSDEEIRLIIYYKLLKLSGVPLGSIYNRKEFINALENMVDKAYDVLVNKQDFKSNINKLDAISKYYFEKVISALKNKNPNLQLQGELVDKIYKNIIELKQKPENIGREKIYYDKFDLNNMSDATLKISIKSQPFIFLSIMTDLGSANSYKGVSSILLEIENLITKKIVPKTHEEDSAKARFYNRYFMIFLFLYSGITYLDQDFQEELLPLVIVEIIGIDLVADNDAVNLEHYDNMIEIWKHKQNKYNDILVKKEEKEDELEILLKEEQDLKFNLEELAKKKDILVKRYSDYKEEFKNIIMSSDKKVLLPSYIKYDELRSKKKLAENNINESKNKFGSLKSILSPEMWKEQASRLINESNMAEAEKKLIEEAKQRPYFKKEYSVFQELEDQIKQIDEISDKNKESLENKNLLIDNLKNRVNELQRQLNVIKGLYPDIE